MCVISCAVSSCRSSFAATSAESFRWSPAIGSPRSPNLPRTGVCCRALMIRLLLVDDHAVVRRGIRAILEDQLSAVEVAEASNGEEALTALEGTFDGVVLDLSMPG